MTLLCCTPRGMMAPWASWRGLEKELDQAAEWFPAVDVQETEHAYTFAVDLPGVAKDDVQIETEGNVLRIKGERKDGGQSAEGACHRLERRHGRFERSFEVPDGFNADQVVANLDNGVLLITLPKREEAKPKHIKVNVN
jgi:HSP20 family protein